MEARRRIYVVDDEFSAQSPLTRLLSENGHQVITFDSADSFLLSVRVEPLSCALLDMFLPDRNGFEVLALLHARRIEIPVVFTAAHCEIRTCVRAMKAGVVDFLTKPLSENQLLEAVAHAQVIGAEWYAATMEATATRELVSRLTVRERQVLALLISGRRNKEIANALCSREATVKVHRCRLMRKLQVHSLVELARFSGLVAPRLVADANSWNGQRRDTKDPAELVSLIQPADPTNAGLRRVPDAEVERY